MKFELFSCYLLVLLMCKLFTSVISGCHCRQSHLLCY